MIDTIAVTIFVFAYVAITFEHKLRLSRSAVALVAGAVLWILIAVSRPRTDLGHAIGETGADIFEIVIFLLAAMSLVEVLVHYRFSTQSESVSRVSASVREGCSRPSAGQRSFSQQFSTI